MSTYLSEEIALCNLLSVSCNSHAVTTKVLLLNHWKNDNLFITMQSLLTLGLLEDSTLPVNNTFDGRMLS